MKKQEYRTWLEGTMKPASIKDRISRCARVEEALGVDLDEEFKKDGGKSVLSTLHYTIHDLRAGKEIPAGFHFKEGTNVNQRMTDMRSAAGRYFDFCASGTTKK